MGPSRAAYVDGHLDLAFNVTASARDLTLELDSLRLGENKRRQEALVTLPELRRGGLSTVFATLFTMPRQAVRPPGSRPLPVTHSYETPEEAKALAVAQLQLYEGWEDEGLVRILRSRRDLEAHLEAWTGGDETTALVLLMEGADPIVRPDDLGWWVGRGLRLLGPAWQRTRYCGGTHAPGPLSDLGRELVEAMKVLRLPLDVSHLAEESFWDALELGHELILASHSNARALTATDRHLSDEMIRAIGERGGVVGLVLGNPFVKDGVTRDSPKESVTLADVGAQASHVAKLIGWDKVAVGSDFDGGFGVQETPAGILRGADFARLGEAVPEEARAGFLGENWLRFLRSVLP
jgi:membrane dipeptidase